VRNVQELDEMLRKPHLNNYIFLLKAQHEHGQEQVWLEEHINNKYPSDTIFKMMAVSTLAIF
jgi:hypothetical protein